ncbi:MAG: modification methylase [Candidatus Buchananbacteria bacterium RIFCSPHIGHO2_01_FULL_39_14]|uniref:Modification methylase n=2 Tax=Candidatus Buchananiibacteriota TaxID=1817903 RepID=A0A1G1YR09_9BACT|nr:MAG: modification methylase [Candidatus Buchananbacteria bacterium RIFCSPHIGHO2_01_FULL_39_14]OGY54246.1 MAG: modification methylase [Candidatus Buchananbacteria bacterium RIFCSPLOWO2_01_FULL_40_23b]
MKRKSSNKNLRKANAAKKDEFYTQLVDIEKELKHYKIQFRGKVVYCNCDDPFESNFFKYFAANFNALGLKKLITTSYVKSPIVGGQLPLFEVEGLKPKGKEPFKIEIKEVPDTDGDGAVNLDDVEYLLKHDKNTATSLRGNGDFRSDECIEFLKKADIVVTNPPFSLFREYVAQLVEHKKKFLIMGNQNAITYKEIFKLIKENQMWLGQSLNGKNILFQIPDYYESYYKIIDGKKYAFPKGVVWFTNLDVPKRNEELVLYKKYTKEQYPRYDNYNAINVDRTEQIPMDYADVMGVPITFLHKYNPNQFEIIDGLNRYTILDVAGLNNNAVKNHLHMTEIGGKSKYFRVLIKNKKVKK